MHQCFQLVQVTLSLLETTDRPTEFHMVTNPYLLLVWLVVTHMTIAYTKGQSLETILLAISGNHTQFNDSDSTALLF